MIGGQAGRPPSHPLPLGNNHPSNLQPKVGRHCTTSSANMVPTTALPAPPSGLQLPGVGRARVGLSIVEDGGGGG